jgi:hypothetical protein
MLPINVAFVSFVWSRCVRGFRCPARSATAGRCASRIGWAQRHIFDAASLFVPAWAGLKAGGSTPVLRAHFLCHHPGEGLLVDVFTTVRLVLLCPLGSSVTLIVVATWALPCCFNRSALPACGGCLRAGNEQSACHAQCEGEICGCRREPSLFLSDGSIRSRLW